MTIRQTTMHNIYNTFAVNIVNSSKTSKITDDITSDDYVLLTASRVAWRRTGEKAATACMNHCTTQSSFCSAMPMAMTSSRQKNHVRLPFARSVQ